MGESEGNRTAPRIWRSLGELAGSRESQAFAEHEFPYGASHEPETLTRRDVLRLGAASAALAGLTACTKLPTEKIVHYAGEEQEEFITGKPIFYTTSMKHGCIAK